MTCRLVGAVLICMVLCGASFAAPSITSLSPSSGAVGASVTITGTNFGTPQGTSTVKFNGTTATTIASWGATSIVAAVPTGATTGNVVVTVSGVASNGKTFTVVSAPSITSLSPTSGAVGAAVTITGTSFGATQGTSTLTFNGTTVTTITSWNATTIKATVPTGATTGNVVVFASGVNSNGSLFTIVPAPSITSLSPTAGAVGAPVTITGTNFGTTQGTSTVKFNGTTATTISTWGATSIVAMVPAAATTGNVVVHASGVDSNGVAFTVLPTPSITSLSPTAGAVGASVTITGTNFGSTQGTSTVKFNGTTATTLTSWGATSIVAAVPTGATTGSVVVTVSGVVSNNKTFTVVPAPNITSLSPTSGVVGASVTIHGANFGSTQGAGTVTFNGTLATTITSWGSGTIVTTVPTGATTGNVVVYASGVNSNGSSFTVLPNITSLSPTTGAVGASVTITGTSFGTTQGTVKFNTTTATMITSWTATSIVATIPTGATTGNVVVTAGGVNSNGVSFTVVPAPSITSLSPTTGAVGALVTITGTNFGTTQGTGTVAFNGTTATTIGNWTATSIVATVPTGAITGNVVVNASGVNSNGSSFTVVAAPNITSLSPATGAVGASVTITGTNFGATQGTSTVAFNGTGATAIGSWTATSIVATVPAGATTGNVVVNASGLNSNGSSFTVVAAPSITSLSPTSGAVGALVTITGANFGATQGTSTVTFNGTVATTITSWGAGSIVAPVPTGATTGNVVVNASGVNSNGFSFTVSYPNSYQYRRTIVLGHANVPNTDQSDFPVLISGVYSYLATVGNGGLVQSSNGYDIIFSSDPEGATKLDHEIDGYNSVTGTVSFWVRIPTLSHTADTTIYLFYGNPNITGSQENKAGVWKNGYASVYHLGNGTTLGLTDSATAGYNLLGSASAVSGKIGGGAAFNGNAGSSYLYYDSVTAYPSVESPATLETWFQLASSAGGQEIVGYGANTWGGSREALYWDGSNILLEFENMAVIGPMAFNSNWHHLVGVYSGGNLTATTGRIYLDGVLVSNAFSAGAPSITTTEFKIGGIPTVTSCCAFNGSVDEVRVSSSARSGDWVATEFANQSSPSTFYAVEGQATASSAPTIQFLSPAAAAIGAAVTIQGAGFQPTQGTSSVAFNGVAATPTSWNDASIVVPVPTAASTGNVSVTVGGVASNGVSFTVLPTPSITSLNPTSGVVGVTVTITGANFGATQGTSSVTFNGTTATPTTWSGTTVTLPVPAGATTGNVIITVGGGASNPVGFTVPPTPNITSLSPSSGRIGTFVTIKGTNFGATQGASTVALNATSAAVSSWNDTNIVAVVPAGASSGPFSVTVNGHVATSPSFTVTAIPSGWADIDVGTGGQIGSATYSNGVFTVLGGGSSIGGTADGMHFVYQTLVGDGTIIARITSLQNSGYSGAEGGVMIRETLNPGAADAVVFYDTYGGEYMQSRATTGANAANLNSLGGNVPQWLELSRTGNTFTGYESPDGVNWTQIASTTVSMAPTVYIGLAVSGYGYLEPGTFDNVSLNSTASPAPVISGLSPTTASVGGQVAIEGNNFGATQGGSLLTLNGNPMPVSTWGNLGIVFTIPTGATSGPLMVSVAPSMNDSNPVHLEVTTQPLPTSWLNQDVGAVGSQTGSATFSGGTFTVTGGGANIGGTADGMHFVYQTLVGDGTIIARITSLQGSGYSGAEGGVMIRETLNPGAADAVVFYDSYGGEYMQSRATTGANAANLNSLGGNLPQWLELSRTGNTFTGYESPDGVNWTQIASTTVSMAPTVYIGLAVSGYGYLEPATFDNVSLNSTASPAPVITGLSATTASVGSQVEVIGNNFGAAQDGSVLLLNGTSIAINLWSNTSIVFTVPVGASSGPLVVSVAPSMNDSNPVTLEVTTQPLPMPWSDGDVGLVGSQIGSATYSSGTFTVAGGGASIGGTADGMHFVYQTLVGDGTIIARVTSLQNSGYSGAEAAVMIRQTLNPGAADAVVFYDGYGGVYMQDRPTTGANAQQMGPQGNYLPQWLELSRAGNTFTGYESPDGVNWTQIASATVSMAPTVYIGLAVSGYGYLEPGTFDNVSVRDGTTPFVSSVTPIVGTIGTSVTITGSNFGTPQGTSTVQFNGALATTVTSWTISQIVATVPSTAPTGTGPVTVTVNSVSSPGVTAGAQFTVIHPVISNLAPPAAPVGGTLTINGSGFGASQNGGVLINGTSASVQSWSDAQVQVAIQASTASGPVTVSNDGIVSNSLPFTVSPPPTITGISPGTGEVGTPVTINGSGFGSTESSNSAAFGGVVAAASSWSDTQIIVAVPPNAITGPVTVTVAGVTAQGPEFILDTIAVLTASNGNQTTFTSTMVGGTWSMLNSQGPGCSSCSVRGNVQDTYDINGNLLTTTDPNGNTITYTYDSANNVLTRSAQLNGAPVTTTYTYNSLGEVLTMTDPLGNTTTNTYDANGNLLTVSSPTPNGQTPSSVTQFTYNALGELTRILDPLNHPTTMTYTAAGLINNVTDAQNHVTTYGYDARGNRTSVIDPINGGAHPTTFAYDAMNRLTGITYPDNTTVSYVYDYRGRRTSATDQNNKTTTYIYDDADRLSSITDASNNLTQYTYDTENNLLSITDGNNHTTYFAYDAMGRVTQTTFPSTLFETYGYDQLYNLTSKTDRKSQTIQYVYDALNRLSSKTYPDSTAANYVYDLVGKVQQVTDPTGTYGFAYDNMGRLIGTTTQYTFLPGHNFQNGYGYDAASNRTSLTAPDGSTNAYNYDALNRLTTLTNSLTGQFGFGYDALSRRTQLTRPNGINTNYNYDSVSHLLSVLHQAGSTTLDGASYGYDSAGNRTSKTNYLNGIASVYGYDAIYELQQVTQGASTTESYSYDAVGNRLSSLGVNPYTYNASNELTATPSGSYGYDNNGSTLTDASGKSYTWDFENRMVSAAVPGTGTVTFKYDPLGRRIQKSSPLGTTNYLYDGINLIEELDSAGNVLARYTHGAVIDEDLSMLRNGATSYYQADATGSITSLSNSAGTLANTYMYDTFGNLTISTGTLTNPFQYTGREFDLDSGLYYYRARYYNVQLGRFISEDPAGFAGGQNFYAYAKNRPTNLIDPTGLFTVRNGIREHDTLNIDSVCGPGTGGACTSATALLMCTCTKDDCAYSWKANAELRLYGDMYIYNGPFSTFPRRPKDRSVVDANTARQHEWNVHLNPAIAAVTPLINALEGKRFTSEADCQADCDKTGTAVTNLFRQTLRSTQQRENNQ
jgi:RHS repeat-associated protein